MVVVGPEGSVALGALPLARLVARAEAVPAEHVEAFRQHRIFTFHLQRKKIYYNPIKHSLLLFVFFMALYGLCISQCQINIVKLKL